MSSKQANTKNNKDMKIIIATLVSVLGLVALPNKAEARHGDSGSSSYTYRSGHASCGCAIYTKRVITGYDCYRRPIYRYYSVPIVHRCHSNRSHHHSYHRPSYGHRGYYSSYSHHNRNYSHHRYGNRISFSTGYGSSRSCR